MFFLLAEKSEGGWIIGLIFGAIWLIFSIVSAITKKQEEAKRQQVRQSLEAGLPRPVPTPEVFQPQVPRRTTAQTQNVAKPRPQQAVQQQPQRQRQSPKRAPAARETKRSAPRTAPPPIPPARSAPTVQAIVAALPATKQDISATEIRAMDAKKPQLTVTADSLHKWLRPATLRQQFMLTEVLQAPIALRRDRE